MKRQSEPLSPPLDNDKDSLSDYSSVAQRNLENLYEFAHTHDYKTSVPTSNEGNVGDVYLVEVNAVFSLYAKFPSGWKSVVLS